MALDGVELAEYGERYVPGSPADKRAERQVAMWFLLSGAARGCCSSSAFIWWPHEYVPAYSDGQLVYALYTPIIGATLGATILFFGIGVVAMAKQDAAARGGRSSSGTSGCPPRSTGRRWPPRCWTPATRPASSGAA